MGAAFPAIVVAGVVKRHGRRARPALDGISLSVPAGQVVGLLGPNGAGKTTLMGCLLGLLRPDAGTVRIDGRPPDDLAVRAACAWVPERPVALRTASGRRFLEWCAELSGRAPAERRGAVDAALDRVGLPDDAARRSPSTWSRGMLQRLALAQALLVPARWAFLDEPSLGLDPPGVLLLRSIVADLRDAGATVVLSSHRLDEVARSCDRVLLVAQGRVTRDLGRAELDVPALEDLFRGPLPASPP